MESRFPIFAAFLMGLSPLVLIDNMLVGHWTQNQGQKRPRFCGDYYITVKLLFTSPAKPEPGWLDVIAIEPGSKRLQILWGLLYHCQAGFDVTQKVKAREVSCNMYMV